MRQRSLFAPRQSAPRAKALATFYWYAVIPADNPTVCWTWRGGCSRKTQRRGDHQRPALYIGSGRHQQRVMHVARFLLCVMTGKAFDDPTIAALHAGHRCGHYWCVNPQHLYWATQSENELDKRRSSTCDM